MSMLELFRDGLATDLCGSPRIQRPSWVMEWNRCESANISGRLRLTPRTALMVGLLLLGCMPGFAADESKPVDFIEDIAPIFQRRCLSCHHDGEAKGDFSLTRASGVLESGYIDTTDAEASYLLELVTSHDGQAEMPKDAAPLPAEEVASLRSWIASGAKWPEDHALEPRVVTDLDWWSLKPIAHHSELAKPSATQVHPVDAMIDEKLAERGLVAVEQADAQTLIRRVTYDLTGLPPTQTEVDAFVRASQTNAEQAWQDAVDRLLDSPAFGEKWGQHWLDVARYAETHGYDKDKPRNNAWPYRDYVIRSFNDDKSYARFVQEQIAGDALFPGEADGVLGLGFLAAGPWDFIGHSEVGEGKLDGRIAKHLDRDEMISAVFNVFMSTTVQCAQCHHHKFDPIRMEDYYRLHAVFAAVDRADRVYDGLPAEPQERKNLVLSEINRLKTEQESLTTKINREVAAKASGIDRRIAELSEKYGTGPQQQPQFGYHSQVTKNADESKWVQLDLGQTYDVGEIRIIPAYDPFGGIGAGFGFPIRYRVEAADDAKFETDVRVLLDATEHDQPNPGTQTIIVSGDGQPMRFLRITATKLRERKNDFIFALGEVELSGEENAANIAGAAAVTAKDSIESGIRWAKANLVDGIFYRELSDPTAVAELRDLRARRAAIEHSLRPQGIDERLKGIESKLQVLTDELKSFPAGRMVYAAATHFPRGGRFAATEGNPRPIHLLTRGDLRSPAERMTPGTLPLWKDAPTTFVSVSRKPQHQPKSEVHTGSSDESQDFRWNEAEARAELARYLTQTDNPLVWRSIVNRLWTWTFGLPLVKTPNDFGRGGMSPSHPELLDELAARLRDDPKHSLKSIVRLLMTSKAYRRSSRIDPEMAKLDAGNTYLWRAHRRRLTAEEFRDSMLAAAGVLDRKIGGESFHDFVIEKPQHSPHYEYHLHDPADPKSHRRSVYRFVVRSQPQPLLTTLDCADPSISVSRRDESTTALQALAAWNNRLVEFASRQLAVRVENESTSPDEQIERACRLVLGRAASPSEQTILKQHLADHGAASLSRVLFNMNAFVYLD